MPFYWYVLHTKANAEYRVARYLDQQGIETFLPVVRAARPRPGYTTVPLFPSYLFAHLDLDCTDVTIILWTPGLRRIVAFDNRLATVPDTVIQYIRQRVEEIDSYGGLPTHDFKPGERVLIRSGPLAGLEGIFEGPLGPAERVRVLIEFLGRLTTATVPVECLEHVARNLYVPRRKLPRRTRGKGRRIRSAQTKPLDYQVAK